MADIIPVKTLEESLKKLGSDDRKAAIRLVADTLGISILNDITAFSDQCNQLFVALPFLVKRAVENIEIDAQSLTTEEALAYAEKLLDIQRKSIDIKRKIQQGKPLFSDAVLSNEEQFVIDLMNSLRTTEEKAEFMQILRETAAQRLHDKEENEEDINLPL
jgi:hypothetical protein